jgi:hypothetical protein
MRSKGYLKDQPPQDCTSLLQRAPTEERATGARCLLSRQKEAPTGGQRGFFGSFGGNGDGEGLPSQWATYQLRLTFTGPPPTLKDKHSSRDLVPACKEEAPCWGHGAFIQIDRREAVVTAEVAVVGAHHRNCVLLLALFGRCI